MKKTKFIEESHKFREALLIAIQTSDVLAVEKYSEEMNQYLHQDTLDIFKRIPDDRLRSFKNFLFSHNTLYSYAAEKGGLPAFRSHYMSEKYAILIEHTTTIHKLEEIHQNMLKHYVDPANRLESNKIHGPVERTANYIASNFNEDITIQEIAERVHVHPTHLMRAFKKEKGITISQYRRNIRIKEAKGFLKHSSLTMTDIAFMVGFNNPQYFSRMFKEAEDITPKEYRSQYSN